MCGRPCDDGGSGDDEGATYGAATVNVADPDWPRSDGLPAEIMVIPFATAVARPLDSPTVATCGSEDDQTNPPLTIAFPFKSRPTAVNWTVPPITAKVVVAGLTSTLASFGPVESPQPIGRRSRPIMNGSTR